MCGIAGFIDSRKRYSEDRLNELALQMGTAIQYRGPDAGDTWIDGENGVALSHRRLAIVDLSPAGAQPMKSKCGRYVIIYNGEVYNGPELRSALERERGLQFRGHSDTEAILEGIAAWGIRETLDRLIGMFAIALWDREEKKLYLVRDRLGIKPLYWSIQNGMLFFASELKALYSHPDWEGDLHRDAISSFMRFNAVPSPHSCWKGTNKLDPGTMLIFDGGAPRLESFWSAIEVIKEARLNPFTGTGTEAVDALETLLTDAVRCRMVADVPLGAFLSGGVDSSTVVALMQASSDRPVKSFSIGFEDEGYNEAKHAAEVARHIGTDHTELYVTGEEARNVIPNLPDMFDEPFSDSSQIPTYLVSRMTRDHVTVALSGDGGDELFGGYNRYLQANGATGRAVKWPALARKTASAAIQSFSPGFLDHVFSPLPKIGNIPQLGDKLHKLARGLGAGEAGLYRSLVSQWDKPEDLILNAAELPGPVWDPNLEKAFPKLVDRMRYLDLVTYLPDDILTKVDRASMAVSLEARVPILDHRVVQFAWQLPSEILFAGNQGKWPLRQLLYKYVPKSLIERPKMGFAVPLGEWLRGPLKDWAEDLLSQDNLKQWGIIDPVPVRRKWKQHLSGNRNWQHHLWAVLMFQAWCQRYGTR